MRPLSRLVISVTTAEEAHLDLLRPLGRLARQARTLSAEFASIDRSQNFELPYHTPSVLFAWREARHARAQLRRAFRRCIRADIPPWKIRLACRS